MDPQLLDKKFSVLQEISHLIAATSDINALANFLLDRAIEYANAEKGSLMLINEGDELYILAARGFEMLFMESYKIKIGEGIAGVVAQNHTPVLVEDIDKDERFKRKKRDRYKTTSFISCPIISRDRVLGVININDKRDGAPFTEDEFNLLKIISDQAAIAIENAFLMNQLKAKANELEEINRRLTEADIDKTEFITRISHELRSPLNAIKGAIYFLQQTEKIKKTKQKEFYDIILKETNGLTSIVDNLIDFLRLENEATAIKKSLVDLEAVLKEVSDSKTLNSIFAKKNLQFRKEIEKGYYEIVGDKIRIIQMFINLIEGLTHYLESGDAININVREDDVIKVDLVISKNIPEGDLSFFFDSRYIFFTEHSEDKIKLYLAKKVAEAHRWGFEVWNAGKTFTVSLIIPKSEREKLEATLSITMDMFVEFITELLDLNTCSIMLGDDITGELTIKGARGLSNDVVKRTRIKFGDQIAGMVAVEGKPFLIEDIEDMPWFKRKSMLQYNTKSLLSLPLKMQEKVIGVLNLNNKKTAEPFTKKDLYIASALIERISYFLDKLYSGMLKENEIFQFHSSFESLLGAVKKYHKKKTVFPELMLKIMEELGADEEEKKKALYVSTIYDLGIVLINESILKKKTLTVSEKQALRTHPYNTISLLRSFEFSEDLKKAILHHHERFDGKGYPKGLKGKEIPLISRVLSVVDSYCAMTADRVYGKYFTPEKALTEIKADSGTIYDPDVVNAFERVFKKSTT
ncbi:MAG: GAF domain-containing protein [Nitrospirae bacterium]|nr:GAF domain-containing protein [Nitrospirota bacterium]